MALDSKEKRQAVFGIARPWMRNTFPIATPDEQWRMSVGNAYGGNALSPVAGAAIMNQIQFANLGADLYNGTLQ